MYVCERIRAFRVEKQRSARACQSALPVIVHIQRRSVGTASVAAGKVFAQDVFRGALHNARADEEALPS